MGHKESKQELTEEDFAMLEANTNFTRVQILEWYDQFRKECVDGKLDRKSFLKFYSILLPSTGNPDEFSNYVFKAFDTDNSGYIDFNEFMLAFSVNAKGNIQDRLNWAFNYYDLDNSGYIDSKELRRVIQAIYRMFDVRYSIENSPENKAIQIFKDLDLNNDRKVSRQEFIDGCIKDEFLLSLLGPTL